MNRSHVRAILHALPVVTLIVVASINAVLVVRYDLSAWHGGGFGMFSSVDHHTSRFIRVTARTPQGDRLVDLEAYAAEVRALKNLPTPRRMSAFLEKLACAADLPAQTSALQLAYYKLDLTRNPVVANLRWQGDTGACL